MAPIVGRDLLGLKQSLRGVCFVAPELDRIGGYELATLALARCLQGRGIPVSIVTTTKGQGRREGSTDLTRIEVRGRLGLLRAFPRLLAFLARQRSNYSIIHCPTFSHLSGLAILVGRILRRPTLVRVATENDVREFAEAPHWKHRLFFWLLRRATGVIAPSAAIRNELFKAGFSNDGVFVFPNAVDVERFRPPTLAEKSEARNYLGLPTDTAVIGTVARLIPRKGIDVLLQAFKIVLHSHKSHLVVVGDGPIRKDLCVLSRDLGIDNSISWIGFQPDTSKWLRAMDVFAFPSRLEGSPNAVLEAMATGLPIVATSIGGVVDLLQEGRTASLVPADDPDALAAALHRLLRDGSLRADLGCRARNRAVDVFSLSGNISRLIDVYLAVQDA